MKKCHIYDNVIVIYSERSKRQNIKGCSWRGTHEKDREIMHNDKKDSELIAEYYDKYEQKLYRLSYAVLGDIWQAEEAVQETFLKVIRYRNMIKGCRRRRGRRT